jgi:hypothetical protein
MGIWPGFGSDHTGGIVSQIVGFSYCRLFAGVEIMLVDILPLSTADSAKFFHA